jgi:hypothetical protein
MSETAKLAESVLLQARVICAAFLVGVLVYAALAVALADEQMAEPLSGLLFTIWLAVAVAGSLGWMFLWRRATDMSASRREILEGQVGPERLLRLLIVAWALLEAVGIFGATVYLLTGRTEVLVLSVLLVVAGTAVSFPRSEWFAPFRGGAPSG